MRHSEELDLADFWTVWEIRDSFHVMFWLAWWFGYAYGPDRALWS